jgi:hypothetical protein
MRRSTLPCRCGSKYNGPNRIVSLILAYIGMSLAAIGEAIMKIGHDVVRASYRLDGQEDLD